MSVKKSEGEKSGGLECLGSIFLFESKLQKKELWWGSHQVRGM